jgi:5-methylcytosine-specific restriction endonuclease McrA
MPRSVDEWIGAHPDAAIPPRVRARVWIRAEGCCQAGCSRKLTPADKWQVDHIVALINGGEHRETNMQVSCDWCHKAKTAEDVAEKSAVYQKSIRHLGIRKTKHPIRGWRRFDGTPVVNPKIQRQS